MFYDAGCTSWTTLADALGYLCQVGVSTSRLQVYSTTYHLREDGGRHTTGECLEVKGRVIQNCSSVFVIFCEYFDDSLVFETRGETKVLSMSPGWERKRRSKDPLDRLP